MNVLLWENILSFFLSLIVKTMPNDKKDDDNESEFADAIINETLFQGDLKIPLSIILTNYNLSVSEREDLMKMYGIDDEEMRQMRHEAAIDGTIFKLWPNNIIEYDFDSKFSRNHRIIVRRAMDHWEQHTCLRFVSRKRPESDYIHFFTDTESSACYSGSIGYLGGKQVINLLARCDYGFALHEIGHALGFAHEQTRPDRDNYITVHFDRLAVQGNGNFVKRNALGLDYQGSPYDYGSVMHYRQEWGSRPGCKGQDCIILSVNNPDEYRRQGSPYIGDWNRGLSSEDIIQTNRLYKCPKRGKIGFLAIEIKHGISLQDTDGLWDDPDPYVILRAVDSNGEEHIQETSYKFNTRKPVWNELILFGTNYWQFFRLSLWDDDVGLDDAMSMSETVPIEAGWHRNLRHCEYTNCSGYVTFSYNFDPRRAKTASLTIHVCFARGLSASNMIRKIPDPYVYLEGVKSSGVKQYQTSRTIYDDINPVWNQWIEFGCAKWNSFFIQIKDENAGIDDKLSDKQWVIAYMGFHSGKTHRAFEKGVLWYEYSLILDMNDCEPNPCPPGSVCIDGCNNHICL